MKVRKVQLEDIPELLEMAQRFNDKYYDIPMCVHGTRKYIETLVKHPDGVALRTDKGMIGGMFTADARWPTWTALVETGWYSEGIDGIRLLNAFERVGRECYADEIRMTTLTSNPRVDAILSRRGYTAIETSHRLIL